MKKNSMFYMGLFFLGMACMTIYSADGESLLSDEEKVAVKDAFKNAQKSKYWGALYFQESDIISHAVRKKKRNQSPTSSGIKLAVRENAWDGHLFTVSILNTHDEATIEMHSSAESYAKKEKLEALAKLLATILPKYKCTENRLTKDLNDARSYSG